MMLASEILNTSLSRLLRAARVASCSLSATVVSLCLVTIYLMHVHGAGEVQQSRDAG